MILCTGFYCRSNLGDDIFHIIFNSIFTKLNQDFNLISLDDCKEIPTNTSTIVLGGGEILNKYFLEKLQNLCEKSKFNGKIIAYSCELPVGDIIPQINLIDWFVLRNKNDVDRLRNHFNSDTFVEYFPDIVCSLNKLNFISEPVTSNKIVTVCLARSIYKSNPSYEFYLKKFVLFLKFIHRLGYSIHLLPFNTSNSNTESDLLINHDIDQLCKQNNFTVTNIVPNSHITSLLLTQAIQQISSSDFTICSRYHAHILSAVCGKPIFSIPHTKKAKEQMITFGLEEWMVEPTLDSCNRPIDFDVPLAMKLFRRFLEDFDNIQQQINSQNFPTMNKHILRIKELLSSEKRDTPPYFVPLSLTTNMVNQVIEQVKHKFNLTNFIQKQNLEITERVSRFMLYQITQDSNSKYYWGLSNKIFKSNFNVVEDLKWICNDYWSFNKSLIFKSKQLNINKIFNLSYIYPHLLENIHRSGWSKTVQNTGSLHNPNGIIFDMFVDKTFHWCDQVNQDLELIPYDRPWVGIVHHTPNQEYTDFNTNNMILKDSFIKSLPNCIGIYTLSDWLKNWFNYQVPSLTVESLIHPTEIPDVKFNFDNFIQNSNKRIIQIGGWLRNPYSIYRIKVSSFLKKSHLVGKNMENYIKPNLEFDKLINNNYHNLNPVQNISSDCSANKYVYYMNQYINELKTSPTKIMEILESNQQSVELINTLSNDDYDKLLSNNIVFLDLIELSACNTLIECIVRNTPIVIKPLEPVVERLGRGYPLYWNQYDNISKILTLENINKAHKYLTNLDKSCYSYDYWVNSIIKSNIFKKSQQILFPFNDVSIETPEIKINLIPYVNDTIDISMDDYAGEDELLNQVVETVDMSTQKPSPPVEVVTKTKKRFTFFSCFSNSTIDYSQMPQDYKSKK